MLDVIFGFLARKTDFYSSGLEDGKAEMLINAAFKKHAVAAEEEAANKKVQCKICHSIFPVNDHFIPHPPPNCANRVNSIV